MHFVRETKRRLKNYDKRIRNLLNFQRNTWKIIFFSEIIPKLEEIVVIRLQNLTERNISEQRKQRCWTFIITDRDICGFVLSRLSRQSKSNRKSYRYLTHFPRRKKTKKKREKDSTAKISCKSESKKRCNRHLFPSLAFTILQILPFLFSLICFLAQVELTLNPVRGN